MQLPSLVGRIRVTRRAAVAGTAVSAILIVSLMMAGVQGTAALFTAGFPNTANLGAAHIFRGERTTTGVSVNDVSSGTSSDQSYNVAFGSDGRFFVSRAWSSSFSSSRYLELDLNSPLAAGLTVSNASLTLRFASDAGTGSLCAYLELRRSSTGAVLSTHGSGGSPLGCTSGSTYSTLNVSLAAVTSSDIANDLRVRIYADDSAAGALRLDRATVTADTAYNTITLYPILTRESYNNGQIELLKWGLGG